jgi:hypothetical protein
MDTTNFDSTLASDDESGPASMPTTLPAPPRMPTFVPHAVSVSIMAPRQHGVQHGLRLVASNEHPDPMQTRATVPALRLVHVSRPSAPPPSIPPTGSTPIRRAA